LSREDRGPAFAVDLVDNRFSHRVSCNLTGEYESFKSRWPSEGHVTAKPCRAEPEHVDDNGRVRVLLEIMEGRMWVAPPQNHGPHPDPIR
jgi:hypothetical protein